MEGAGVVSYSIEHNLNTTLHYPCMGFVTQVMGCELVFQAIGDRIGFP